MTDRALSLTILGSGTSTGVPVLGCGCEVCRSGLPQNQRTRCSALLSLADRNVLIDTSTDFRQQGLRAGLKQVDAVLFTHTHADHVHGIDDLRTLSPGRGTAIPVYGSSQAMARIRQVFSYIFFGDGAPGYRPRLDLRSVDGPFELFGEVITPVPLEHGAERCLGYRVGPLAYLTDCSHVPATSMPLLEGLELLVVDALRFTAHDKHFTIDEAISLARALKVPRTVLTHLGHDVDYARHGAALPAGVEFAYDGQQLILPAEH